MWWLFLLVACGGDPPVETGDPVQAIARVKATLSEVARLDGMGHDEEARVQWRRANAEFETNVEPALRGVWADLDVTDLELRFGRMRAAIESDDGCRTEARALAEGLDRAAASLAEVPTGTEGTGG